MSASPSSSKIDPEQMENESSKRTQPSIRILYVDGPGNVIDTFAKWQKGQHDNNEVSLAFSEEFFTLTRDLNAEATVVATHPEAGYVQQGNLTVLHHPVPTRLRGGLSYHLGEVRFALWLVYTAIRMRAQLIVIADRMHWFALWPARLFGIRIIAMIHCALWPKGFPETSSSARLLNALSGQFWRSSMESVLYISPEAERQYSSALKFEGPLHQVRSQYFPEVFTAIPPPLHDEKVLRVFFAGRMEPGKGIFDLLEIAVRLDKERPGQFHFELAGIGSAFEQLQQQAIASGLEQSFLLLGKLDMKAMALAYARNQVVIVPTNASFAEGMNRVCIESILAHRPLVTSPASHVTDVLRDAVLEVPVGDIDGYCRALMSLHDDPALYHRLSQATELYTAPFYDRSQGYRASLFRAIKKLSPGAEVPARLTS